MLVSSFKGWRGGMYDPNDLLCPKPHAPKMYTASEEQSSTRGGGEKLDLTETQEKFLAELTPQQKEKYKEAFFNKVTSAVCTR